MTTPVYRERRRLAKLRRRARDREIAEWYGCLVQRWRWRDKWPNSSGWWSTPGGRREWLADDSERKRSRRARIKALNEGRPVYVALPGVP